MRTVFLAVVFLLLFQNHAFAQGNSSTIRVGIFQNYPLVFIDDNGVPQGLYIDLLREIANDEGWDIQFVPGIWSEGLERLRSDVIDHQRFIKRCIRKDGNFVWGEVSI